MGTDDLCPNCLVSFPALVTGSLRLKHRTIFLSINTPDSLCGLGLARMTTTSYLGPTSGQQTQAHSQPQDRTQRLESPTTHCSQVLVDTATGEQGSSEANFLVLSPVYLPERQKPGWESRPHH